MEYPIWTRSHSQASSARPIAQADDRLMPNNVFGCFAPSRNQQDMPACHDFQGIALNCDARVKRPLLAGSGVSWATATGQKLPVVTSCSRSKTGHGRKRGRISYHTPYAIKPVLTSTAQRLVAAQCKILVLPVADVVRSTPSEHFSLQVFGATVASSQREK